METETLRWFLAVADGATVAEAAARAHTTQPAVTRGLQRLAAEVGVPLTERSGRRLQLTFAGEIVATGARRAVAELDAAQRAVAGADDPAAGVVRLGFLSPQGAWLIPALISRFHAERPGVSFELRHDGVHRILPALRAGELDMAIVSAHTDAALSWERLFREEILLAVPASHRLAGRRQIRMTELANENWVLLTAGYGLRSIAERLCTDAGFSPRVVLEDQDLTNLFALIGAGTGIGVFVDRPIPPAAVRQISLSPRAGRDVGLVLRRDGVIPAAARDFADFVREQAPSLAGSAALDDL